MAAQGGKFKVESGNTRFLQEHHLRCESRVNAESGEEPAPDLIRGRSGMSGLDSFS